MRSSDGAPDITVADNSPDAAPRGMAIRFGIGRGTDIVALSHNGFVVGNGEDFLALLKAQVATDPAKPHPCPIEAFLALGSHPKVLKFVQDPKPVPVSFATESFYGNNAFIFVNSKGRKLAGRYQIVPADGAHYLDGDAAKIQVSQFPQRGTPALARESSGQLPPAAATRRTGRPDQRWLGGLAGRPQDGRTGRHYYRRRRGGLSRG